MKDSEAVQIVQMILNSWPGGEWTEDQMATYAVALRPLDAEHVTKGLALAVKELRFRPSIAELREFARTQKMLAQQAEDWRQLPAEPTHKPDWVERWRRARNAGDRRPFPEQIPGYRALVEMEPLSVHAYKLPDVPTDDREHWVQPDEYPNSGAPPNEKGEE